MQIVNNEKKSAFTVLKKIRHAIDANDSIIPLDADFYFTKGLPGQATGNIYRDKELEQSVIKWIGSRTSFENVIQRYQTYYPELLSLEWPSHYATRFINAQGRIAEGKNIFMFFPEVLGIESNELKDYFGFEFIDLWVDVFDEIIFPCVRRIFDSETQIILFSALRPNLEKIIYLSAVFHEIGHRCGFWRVSPSIDPKIKINKFHTDVLGELSTDTLLCCMLKEFPEVVYFIFLQRLFWFGRFNFKNKQKSGALNEDNDTWIGSYLWNFYEKNNILEKRSGENTLHVNFEKLLSVFPKVLIDIDTLGKNIICTDSSQDDLIHLWMKNNVMFVNEEFVYPASMVEIFLKCIDVIETPLRKF